MKSFLFLTITLLFISGCSATWNGFKQDTTDAAYWTKGKVNSGAAYVKEKTD
jgi:hypothetical protein